MFKDFKAFVIRFLMILFCCGLANSALADSPLTSTNFYKAYLDIDMVKRASETHAMDEEMAGFLSSPDNRVDIKAAVVNALSWQDEAGGNAAFYLDYLLKSYQQGSEANLVGRLSADELLCLGYLKALADYFHPENAVPLLKQAEAQNPESFTTALILMLAEAEAAMNSDWCKVWRLSESVLNDSQLQREMRPEAVGIVEDYLINYKQYCPPDNAAAAIAVKGEDPCANPMTQMEMNQCAIKEYQDADGELNRVYKEVMAKLRPEMQAKLKTAQKAWLQYRDANCDCASFDYSQGSIYPVMYYGCLKNMTVARTKEIQDLLKP